MSISEQGYGIAWSNGRHLGAHRMTWIDANGPVPDGLVLDHLCRNRACVNVLHLEPVTNRENTLRGESKMAINARQTHCVWGHEFNEANTIVRKDRPKTRECLECARRRCRECMRRKRAKAKLRRCT